MPRIPQVTRLVRLAPRASFASPVAYAMLGTVVANLYHRHWSHDALEKDITRLDIKMTRLETKLETKLENNHQDLKTTIQIMWGKSVHEELKNKGRNQQDEQK